MSLFQVGTFNFEQEVEKSDKPVVVLVSSENCESCRAYTKVVEQAVVTHSHHFKFVLLISNRSPELAEDIADGNNPSTAIFTKGKMLINLAGAVDFPFLAEFLNRQLSYIRKKNYNESKNATLQAGPAEVPSTQ